MSIARRLTSTALLLAACSPAVGAPDAAAPTDLALANDLAPSNALVAARPYETQIPAAYDGSAPAPLVIVLHGYGITGLIETRYLGFARLADERGFLVAYPDGTRDQSGQQFWAAGDNYKGDGGTGVDDVAYLDAVIDDMSAHYLLDSRRIYLVGHSNGAFMAQYYACRHPERAAALVSLAGGLLVGTDCTAGAPVALAEVHGDADDTIEFGGGKIQGMPYLSVADMLAQSIMRDGCQPMPDLSAPPLDLESSIAGTETSISRWTGCRGGALELWTVHGGGHIPNLTMQFAPSAYDFLSAHARP